MFVNNRYTMVLRIAFLTTILFLTCRGQSSLPSLEGKWSFRYDHEGSGLQEKWYLSQEVWEDSVMIPGFWEDASYDGYGWFRTDFILGNRSKDERLALIFESVDDNADVWINGIHVGSHQGYGEQFWFEITDVVVYDDRNVLTVRIEDTGGPGGINGGVHMMWYGEEKEFVESPLSKLTAVESPTWVQKAIIYEIFVRDFSEAGDFNGVTKKLDDLKELGVDCIWLMPIHPIGKVKRKGEWGSPYSCMDYYAITPDYGTHDDFRRLVQETHKRGMRIILDMVLNHSAWDNPLLKEHPDWYTRNEKGDVISPNEHWWDVADFNYNSQELRKYMIEMLKFWVEEYNVDGFRFDVAELIPMDFWIQARAVLKSIKPDILFLAEGDIPELHVEAFDLSYSWNVWHHVIEVSNGRKTVKDLKQTLINETYRYPKNSLRMRFVENHDKQRAASVIPRKALRLAHAFIYTIPGVPLLYNGEEVALEHRLELFPKDPIDWSAGDEDFRQFMVELGKLKHGNDDLSHSKWNFINQDLPQGVVAWRRGSSTICAANFGESGQEIQLEAANLDSIEIQFSIRKLPKVEMSSGFLKIELGSWDFILVREPQRAER